MKKIFSVLFTLLFTAGLVSCGQRENIQTLPCTDIMFEYFDTVTEITAYGAKQEEFDTHCGQIEEILAEYHRLFDIYHSYSGTNNLHTVNAKAGKEPVKVDKKLIDFLLFAKEMYTLTKGQVNIAFGAVTSLWHEARETGEALPEKDALLSAAEHCNIDDVIIDTDGSTVFLRDEKMSIDAGALGKGYACEMAARYLEAKNQTGYALNLGGNIRVTGKKTDTDYWSAGIQNPDVTSSVAYIETVLLKENALVTSGSYMRYYTVDGVDYHHIIDPDTLYPQNEFTSVSVLCGDSALGDALSTALFNMSVEDGKSLINSIENAHAMWVDKDGKVYYSDNFKSYLIDS